MIARRLPQRRDAGSRFYAGALLVLLCIACFAFPIDRALAQEQLPPPEGPEAWLVTYGPGEVYWQRFGHNAIWLREPGGLDHTFNYGFFDFEQESFLLRFVQGRMLYFAAAMPADQEFAFYASEGREIRVQRLNLDAPAYARLRAHLLANVRLENRDYLYDYYFDNCSTRIRDALDLALDGQLKTAFEGQPAVQNLRDHTRRSTEADRAYYLGLVAALGMPIDRSIDRWTEQFLPAVLAEDIAGYTLASDSVSRPLVTEDVVLRAGDVPGPPSTPGSTWWFYLMLGTLAAFLVWLAGRLPKPVLAQGLVLAWMLINGTLGLGLLMIWGFTDHHAAYPNLNLMLLQPTALLALWRPWRRGASVILLIGGGLALVSLAFPAGQYMADSVAFILPMNLICAWVLLRDRKPAA